MTSLDRASFAAYDAEFVVEISRCRAPLHCSTTQALRPAADVELYSSTALSSSTVLQRSTLYILYTLPQQVISLLRSTLSSNTCTSTDDVGAGVPFGCIVTADDGITTAHRCFVLLGVVFPGFPRFGSIRSARSAWLTLHAVNRR